MGTLPISLKTDNYGRVLGLCDKQSKKCVLSREKSEPQAKAKNKPEPKAKVDKLDALANILVRNLSKNKKTVGIPSSVYGCGLSDAVPEDTDITKDKRIVIELTPEVITSNPNLKVFEYDGKKVIIFETMIDVTGERIQEGVNKFNIVVSITDPELTSELKDRKVTVVLGRVPGALPPYLGYEDPALVEYFRDVGGYNNVTRVRCTGDERTIELGPDGEGNPHCIKHPQDQNSVQSAHGSIVVRDLTGRADDVRNEVSADEVAQGSGKNRIGDICEDENQETCNTATFQPVGVELAKEALSNNETAIEIETNVLVNTSNEIPEHVSVLPAAFMLVIEKKE